MESLKDVCKSHHTFHTLSRNPAEIVCCVTPLKGLHTFSLKNHHRDKAILGRL